MSYNSNTVRMVNSSNISFPSFYQKISEIKEYKNELNFKYRIAYCLCEDDNFCDINELILHQNMQVHSILRWIFDSGYVYSFNEDYMKIIDYVSYILLVNYKDYNILPSVCNLIFKRNREKLYNHDLIWAYFSAENKLNIKLLTQNLNSNNTQDQNFACEIINMFNPEQDMNITKCKQFINENLPYLYYTKEHFLMKSNPVSYKIDKNAKILKKSIIDNKKISSFSEQEQKTIAVFNDMEG